MKSFNHLYKDENSLDKFSAFHKKEISAAEDVLITLYSGQLDVNRNQKVLDELRKYFPSATVTGATTAGEIYGKSVKKEEILITLHIFKATKIQQQYISNKPIDEMASEITSLVKENTKGILIFAVTVSDYFDIEMLLELTYGSIPKIPVFGGSAAENGTFTKQFCFLGKEIYDSGLTMITFESDVLNIQTDYSFNWMPVGREFTITEVENNIVKTIDHKPAVQVIKENLGSDSMSLLPSLGLEFPFVFKRRGTLIARVMLSFDGDNVVLAAPVEKGAVFQFSFGSRKNAIEYSLQLSEKYAELNFESIMAFSCVARLSFLQSDAQKELSNLSESANISGFFTYGEIYHSEKANYYLNETLTLAFFSENMNASLPDMPIVKKEKTIKRNQEDARLKILTHLVSKVTNDLEDKNIELRKSNDTLREYSNMIDERNGEISQSLRYASKLQNSIVFQDDGFSKAFDDHFIFFKPKEQVSGDFYFLRDIGDKIVLAVADGTGHGVPGAFISILGVQIMHAITRKMKSGRVELNAGDFLNSLREKMKRILERNQISKFSTDGLDISLLIIDKKTRQIDFSGANQSIIIYTNDEMIQLKGDRMPIGAFVQETSFSNTSLLLEGEAKVFMYTDGFADQFGGENGKKINSLKLRNLIKDHSSLPFDDIKEKFENYFQDWKGDWEQTDDVLILGYNL